MTLHQRILEAARRTKTTLYIITAVYVGIGFFLAIPAALSGDRLTAFLGFLIISGALGAAAVVGAVIRLTTRITAGGECFEEIRARLEQIECAIEAATREEREGGSGSIVDLASFGKGEPEKLVAASLDRDAFPRLVTTMEEQPPASTTNTVVGGKSAASGRILRPTHRSSEKSGLSGKDESSPDSPGITTKNLLREWRLGMRNSDLAACRKVYSTLVDTVDANDLSPLTTQLSQLADRKEASLREAFSRCAHRRDYAGMLDIGEEMCRLLPARPVAAEFRRVKPHLLRRLKQCDGHAEPPTLRVVR